MPKKWRSSSNGELEVNMAKRAAKEHKGDVVARDLENLPPGEVREEFFQTYSVDQLKRICGTDGLSRKHPRKTIQKGKLSRLAFSFFQLYIEEEGDTEGNEKRENLIKSKQILDDGTQLIVDLVKDPSKWSKDINDFPMFIYIQICIHISSISLVMTWEALTLFDMGFF